MWDLEDYCRAKQDQQAENGYRPMPCASFHNLDIQTPEIYQHRLKIVQTLLQRG